MSIDLGELRIVKRVDATTQPFGDLAVDPNNPNADQTPGALLFHFSAEPTAQFSGEVFYKPPAGRMDDGLLLPAVGVDDGEAHIKDGTSNTLMLGEVFQPSPEDEVLIAFEFGDKRGDTFDFKKLTSEPTVQEGRHIGDCEAHVFLSGQILGGETDIGGFIAGAPATPQPDSSAIATMIMIEFNSALHTSDGFFLT